jgi:hypothetical protein
MHLPSFRLDLPLFGASLAAKSFSICSVLNVPRRRDAFAINKSLGDCLSGACTNHTYDHSMQGPRSCLSASVHSRCDLDRPFQGLYIHMNSPMLSLEKNIRQGAHRWKGERIRHGNAIRFSTKRKARWK